jgi:hypothetical protein
MPNAARVALSISVGIFCAFVGREAAAKAAYVDLATAVELADTIAVVHTEVVEAADFHGEHWRYRQLVYARMVATLKGESPEVLRIAANKEFICAPVPFDAGADYLVFLADDGGRKATVNNEMGRLAITDGFVDWPYGDSPGKRALPDAMLEVQRLVGDPAPMAALQVVPPNTVRADPPQIEPEASSSTPAPVWIAIGAFAVGLGMLVASRRRRSG